MPSRRPRAGPEPPHDRVEVVGAVEQLDHHALAPQVVAPDLLHQLGVVDALHEDAAGPGHPGACGRVRPPSPRRCEPARRAPVARRWRPG